MNCLILGGAGFIGSHLAETLAAQGARVRVFDRPNVVIPPVLANEPRIEWVSGDFQSAADVQGVVRGTEVIFHLVSTTLPKSSNEDPEYDVTSNVVGTIRLLKCAVQSKVRKVVFISSGGTVYGRPQSVPIAETHPTDPLVSYGITKLAIEKYLALYHVLEGLAYTVLRVANPYGERQRTTAAQGAVAVFARHALADRPLQVWGDGSVVRDYVYIEDVVRAFLLAASYEGEERVFNIGSGAGLSLNEVLATMEDLLGRPVRRDYLPGRKFDVPRNVLDVSRARALLGWQPEISFREGLRRTLDWIRANPDPV